MSTSEIVHRWQSIGITIMAAACVVFLLTNCWDSQSASDKQLPPDEFSVVSSRTDTVSGGDLLLNVSFANVSPADVVLKVNGVTSANKLKSDKSGRMLVKVDGLALGENVILAEAENNVIGSVKVTNSPASGPIISGPHQQPWVCETENFTLPNGTKLPKSTLADCSVPTDIQYIYMNTAGEFVPLTDTAFVPADAVKTTTIEGKTVNFIVRVETGTINRGINQTWILQDPTVDKQPTAWNPPAGWNGILVVKFGGSCNPGYHQGLSLGSSLSDSITQLGLGYAVTSSTLNVWGNNCNSLLSAETVSMLKEEFIETYGVPKYTIGMGQSGGAKQQFMIADNYPGLLDGILPAIVADGPDGVTANPASVDCALMAEFFNNKSTLPWTYGQKTAVAGWRGWNNCEKQPTDSLYAFSWYPVMVPNYMLAWAHMPNQPIGCTALIPQELIYDKVLNPAGIRCDVYSNQMNIFGESTEYPSTPRRPVDSVGVQYGLAAFNAGTISAEQFVELNELIGGYDFDGNYISGRSVADVQSLRISYQTGQVLNGGGGLNSTPIIDMRRYTEDFPDIHDRVASFSARERMIAANGDADNFVMFTWQPDNSGLSTLYSFEGVTATVYNEALEKMTQWLDNIAADKTTDNRATKVRRNKPADLADACWDASGTKIVEPASRTGNTTCNNLFPSYLNPRLATGMPITQDVLKCQLMPINATDYQESLTAAQIERLNAAFPDGVCDFSKPGVEQQPLSGTWISFTEPGEWVKMSGK